VIYTAKMPDDYARVQWCNAAFGTTKEIDLSLLYRAETTEGLRWWSRPGDIYFRDEQDYVLYTMRWS
jgi:hypothetical protein